ncbi:hypothetical protein OIU77_001227 [Salix suchowensis]|uniref:HMA domain-containing protein n=1 Tax=Salix suchowensis TaxID=1278906 RepID=A0ABQ9B2X5_9ROSI|nr:hypothetical protein OIU77_001227 [Salix suchowensis]
MKTVSGLPGVESVSIEMKDQKLTVIGDIDPVHIVAKLRKQFHTQIITVGPAKEPEKKKDEPKKEEPKKQGDQKKKDPADHPVANCLSYYPPMPPSLIRAFSTWTRTPAGYCLFCRKLHVYNDGDAPNTSIEAELTSHLKGYPTKLAIAGDYVRSYTISSTTPSLDDKTIKGSQANLEKMFEDLVVLKCGISRFAGVESRSIEHKNKTMTVIGDIDAIQIVNKLRKLCVTELISIGPAKEPKKKEGMKKKEERRAL